MQIVATKQRAWRLAMLVLLVALLDALSGCAPFEAWRKCASGCPGDAEIATAVRTRLREHTELLAPNQVDVRVMDGVVYLSGQVATDLQRDDAGQIARQAAGAHAVVNIIGLAYPGW